MDECERLTNLIADIYDAALNSELWPHALKGAQEYVGGCATNLFWHDAATEKAAAYYSHGIEPHQHKLYAEKYVTLNPHYPACAFVECGLVKAASDLIPINELKETRFFKEWLAPQGQIDTVFVNLDRTATSSSVIAIIRSQQQGEVDQATRRRMKLIAPHLMRAVAVGQLIDRQNAAMTSLTTVLDSLATAAFLVNASGRIAFVNGAGQSLLRCGEALRETHGALSASQPDAARALRTAIASAASGDGDGEASTPGPAIPLLQEGQIRWLAHVLPLSSGVRREAFASPAAVAAVFVRKVELDAPSALEIVAKLYRLTASEVRTLQAIVDLGGVPATAVALGVADTTVKSHLSALYAKTGAHRQADLVKLMATHASPFRR